MRTIILDDHGQAWDAASPSLRSFLHCSLPDFDFLTYLVENLGFVAVTQVAPNAARVRFRPETVSQTSIAAALYYLADMGVERIIISHPGQFVEKLLPSLAQTIAYLSEQIGASQRQPSSPFKCSEQPVEMLANADEALSSLFAQWMDSEQVYDSATLAVALPQSLRARYLLVEPSDGRLTITDVGPGFEIFGETWRNNARGRPMQEQPDYDYGQWTEGMYRRVHETQRPRLDEIDAIIRRPHRNDRIHRRYRRLILPFICRRSGRPCLLGASISEYGREPPSRDRLNVEVRPA